MGKRNFFICRKCRKLFSCNGKNCEETYPNFCVCDSCYLKEYHRKPEPCNVRRETDREEILKLLINLNGRRANEE